MKRKYTKKTKVKPEIEQKTGVQPEMPTEKPQGAAPPPPPVPIPIEQEEYFNVYGAAQYLHVSEDAIRVWISHGHLELKLIGGVKLITLTSILKCRLRVRLASILPDKALFRPDEVASLLSLSVKTIYGWIDEGKIKAVTVGPAGTIRITRDVVEKMIQPKTE